MSYRQILTYIGAAERGHEFAGFAGSLAGKLGANLTGLLIELEATDFRQLDRAILDNEREQAFRALTAKREQARDAQRAAERRFRDVASRAGVSVQTVTKACASVEVPEAVMLLARLHDCSILPASEELAGYRLPIVEEVLFGSGRPLVVVPGEGRDVGELDSICVAWDGSRAAARAVHDSLPLLRCARTVEVLTIVNEKPMENVPGGQELLRYLDAHGISAKYRELAMGSAPIGEQLMSQAADAGAGLLVMGAYGHSRMRQIVFGGATRSIIKEPLLPVFLSY